MSAIAVNADAEESFSLNLKLLRSKSPILFEAPRLYFRYLLCRHWDLEKIDQIFYFHPRDPVFRFEDCVVVEDIEALDQKIEAALCRSLEKNLETQFLFSCRHLKKTSPRIQSRVLVKEKSGYSRRICKEIIDFFQLEWDSQLLNYVHGDLDYYQTLLPKRRDLCWDLSFDEGKWSWEATKRAVFYLKKANREERIFFWRDLLEKLRVKNEKPKFLKGILEELRHLGRDGDGDRRGEILFLKMRNEWL